jgi:Flp pilus assembly protein TadB
MIESQAAQLGRLSLLLGESKEQRGVMRGKAQRIVTHLSVCKNLFERAGRPLPRFSQCILSGFVITVVTLIASRLVGLIALLIPVAVLGIYYIWLQALVRSRVEHFERDYTAFLLSLASSIRTGQDPLMAFTQCGKLFSESSVLALEVKKTAREIESGKGEEWAFGNFANSIKHPDIALLRAALILSRRQGSSLGTCLHRLARVTRQRQSFRRKIRGAVAMQRLSAFGIAACTVIVAIIQVTSNPRAIRDAWQHPIGSLALAGGIALVILGLGWMIYMSRRRL